MDTILVVNAGSSSVKFQVFGIGPTMRLERIIKGAVEGIGIRPRFRARSPDGRLLFESWYSPAQVPDLPAAMRAAGAWLRDEQKLEPVAAGHRVAHGGPEFDRPVRVTAEVIAQLERYIPLAPLHQPNNLSPIRALMGLKPDLPQFACFDTAFHRGHSPIVDHYAIPESFYIEGVRRYGFHGLSYEYVASHLRKIAPEIAGGRVIVAHLGSGSSLCALSNGRSIETTMGFSALDGLPMGTRTGQIDPGVVLYLIGQKGMTPKQVQDLFYKESGLKALSGLTNDMRDLVASSDSKAAFAVDYFVYRIGLQIGMLVAALDGVDALVFTAGIGENSATIRERCVDRLKWLGVTLDPVANSTHASVISSAQSHVLVRVVPTDEEVMIARHTVSLLCQRNEAPAPSEGTII